MCGIVAYVGPRDAADVVLDGLERLEYRGYDSAGVALWAGGEVWVRKRVGRVAALRAALAAGAPHASLAMGHTRWATHGAASEANAHPHVSEDGAIALVHNGIIHDDDALRDELRSVGHVFASDTDSEVLVHLIEEVYRGDLAAAVASVLARVKGAVALAVMHAREARIVAAARTSPLVIGVGEGEWFLSSDIPALLPYTRRTIRLHDGDLAIMEAAAVRVVDRDGRRVDRPVETIDLAAEAADRGDHPHFMLKEMLEQPAALERLLAPHLRSRTIDLPLDPALSACHAIVLTGAGSAAYAAAASVALLEHATGLPVAVESASELRSRDALLTPGTLVIALSQSGETSDTLEAVRAASARGARTLALVNVAGSNLARIADASLPLRAGPEIGVASTKAYTAMWTALALVALWWGQRRGVHEIGAAIDALRGAPAAVAEALASRDHVRAVAPRFAAASALYLGRGAQRATALEGALKLKELAYVHAEGLAMGELKHGPLALIDAGLPIVALATPSPAGPAVLASLAELRARGARVIAVAAHGDRDVARLVESTIPVPSVPGWLAPLVGVIPLQWLAYETASWLGRDVDRPRHLAKSVTVA